MEVYCEGKESQQMKTFKSYFDGDFSAKEYSL